MPTIFEFDEEVDAYMYMMYMPSPSQIQGHLFFMHRSRGIPAARADQVDVDSRPRTFYRVVSSSPPLSSLWKSKDVRR